MLKAFPLASTQTVQSLNLSSEYSAGESGQSVHQAQFLFDFQDVNNGHNLIFLGKNLVFILKTWIKGGLRLYLSTLEPPPASYNNERAQKQQRLIVLPHLQQLSAD